jgi:hypothetical protein
MDPSFTTPSLYERLLAISREAHERGQLESAYHALTAAMHAADDAADIGALAVVRREAELQIMAIDRDAPEHRLSTSSAARHQHPGVYAMLGRQARMHMGMHEVRELPGTSGSPMPQ